MKKTGKVLLSIILILAMLLGFAPGGSPAMAEGGAPPSVEEVQAETPETEEPAAEPETEEPAAEPEAEEPAAEPETEEPAAEPEAEEPAAEPEAEEPAAEPETEEPAAEPETEEPAAEESAAEPEPAAFRQSAIAGGVRVSVSAEPGVFPAGAVLSVSSVPVYRQQLAEAAVENRRDEGQNVAVSYTFDIKVLDAHGAELQPADGRRVSVSFALAEVADPNLDTQVYHITDSGGALSAEPLPVSESGVTATAQTDGFSLYTVEFTYNSLRYELPGDSSVPLAAILDAVGLSGEVTAVSCSDESLFSASNGGGEWIVTANGPFTSAEWMDVTIGGVTYRIDVTDAIYSGTWDTVPWSFDTDTGVLTLGEGAAYTVAPTAAAPADYPWDAYRAQITTVAINSTGITASGSLAYMFYGCSALTALDLSGFATAGVTDMNNMFYGCSSLATLDVTSFVTTGVTNMNSMFRACSALTALDVTGFATGNVTDMGAMFDACSSLTSLDLSGFDMGLVTDRAVMLSGLTGLKVITFGPNNAIDGTVGLDYPGYLWSSDHVTTYTGSALMTALSGDPTGMAGAYDRVVVISYAPGDAGATGTMADVIVSIDAAANYTLLPNGFGPPTGKSFYAWELGGAEYPEAEVVAITDSVTVTALWASGGAYDGVDWRITPAGVLEIGAQDGVTTQTYAYQALRSAADYPWYALRDTVTAISFVAPVAGGGFHQNMFAGEINATSASCANFDTATVTDLGNFFNGCSSLSTVDVSGWDLSGVTNIGGFFGDCTSLTSLTGTGLAGWNTANVENLWGMFNHCSGLTDVSAVYGWDVSSVTRMEYLFNGCSGLTALDLSGWDTGAVTQMEAMFLDCSALTTVTFGAAFDTANVTSMRSMFYRCSGMTSLDLSGFDTGAVTDMNGMFYECGTAALALDLSGFNTEQVTTMENMFRGSGVGTLTLGAWDLSTAANINSMFDNCANLTELDLSGWTNSSGVTAMRLVFNGMSALETLDLSGLDINAAADKAGMMIGLPALQTLKLGATTDITGSGFDSAQTWTVDRAAALTAAEVMTASAGGTAATYYAAYTVSFIANGGTDAMAPVYWPIAEAAAYTLPANGFTPPAGRAFETWDLGAPGTTIALTGNTNVYAQWTIGGTFEGVDWRITSAGELQLGNQDGVTPQTFGYVADRWENYWPWYTYRSTITSVDFIAPVNGTGDHSRMFYATQATDIDLTNFNADGVTSLRGFFDGNNKLTALDLSPLAGHTANVTDMSYLFEGCTGLTTLDLSPLDTANVTDMAGMFYGCGGLTALDLSPLDTSKVTSMDSMFYRCSGLTALDVSGFDTAQVTNMVAMFDDCSSLTSLDLSGFDTANVTDMGAMFAYCTGFTTLDLSGFDTSSLTSTNAMFDGCTGLTSLDLSAWDVSSLDDLGSMFDGCSNLASLDLSGWTLSPSSVREMFQDCSALTELDLSGFTASGYQPDMLSGLTNLHALTLGPHIDLTYTDFDAPGRWSRDPDAAYTAAELAAAYNGAAMAGTYKVSYVVSFDANGGTGTMPVLYAPYDGTAIALPDSGFIGPNGYVFQTWDLGDPGTAVGFTGDATVTARWHQVWNAPTWTWAADVSAATATFTCQNDATNEFTQTLTAAVTTADSATCEAGGLLTGTATVSFNGTGYTDSRSVASAPLGHVWDAGTVTTAPTCSAVGVMTYTCTRDPSHTRTEDIAMIPHTWDTVWHGNINGHWHICTVCGAQDAMQNHVSSGPATEEHGEWCLLCQQVLAPRIPYTSNVLFRNSGDTRLEDILFTQEGDDVLTYSIVIPNDPPVSANYYFEGWYCTADGAMHAPGDMLTGTYGILRRVVFSGVWTQIIGVGTYDLEGDGRYRFDEGRFVIEGDGTVYEGAQYFYPNAGGTMTISEGGQTS